MSVAHFLRPFAAATFLGAAAAWAGSGSAGAPAKTAEPAEPPEVPINIVDFRYTHVFESGFRRGAGRLGGQDADHSAFEFGHRFALGGGWYLRAGAAYDRSDFGASAAPLETTLQSAAGVVALEYFRDGRRGFYIQLNPGWYFSDDAGGDAFDCPALVALAIPVGGPDFVAVVGATVGFLREYPVLPAAGFRWRVNDTLTLEAYLPKPRLTWSPGDSLTLWAGGEFFGGTYRTSSRDATPPSLSGAVVSYREYRAGAGAGWRVCPGFEMEIEGGYVFAREFDYHRAGEKFGLEGAPYVSLSGRMTF